MRSAAAAAVFAALAPEASGQASAPANAAPAPYVDRVIEGISAEPELAAERPYDASGWPRFLRLETRLGTQPFGDSRRRVGVVASAGIETPNHGTLSVDANLAPSEGNSVVTVRQRGLPAGSGWFVNNELGVLTPHAPSVMRAPTRVFVPSIITRGGATEWLGGDGTQRLASSGQLGALQGYPVPGFRALGGTVSMLAAQTAVDGWTVAARHAHADRVSPFEGSAARTSGNSTHFVARRESVDESLQAQVIQARSDATSGGRYAVWIDGESRHDRTTYGWGLYRLDSNLTWAGQPMASDLEGVYARGAWHTRQWSATGSVDVLRSQTGSEETGVLVTANGQWRYSRRLTFGAGASVRRDSGTASTSFGDMRWLHDHGRSGLRLEHARYSERERTSRIVLDHDWPFTAGWAFATSLWGGRETGAERGGTLWGAATSLSAPLSAYATLLANATYERRGNGDRFASANLSLAWQLTRDWSVEGNAIYSRGTQRVFAPIDPLAPLERVRLTDDNHSVFLVVRYESRAGSRRAPLGGPAQGGGGRIVGRVFLDANRTGTLEAGESGAPNVTVYLDGRFATRTDSQGRFEFPFVAPGSRLLTVLNETLPLPWEAAERPEHRVEVGVRETTELLIPAVRRD